MKMDALRISHKLLKHPFLSFPSALQHSNAHYPGNIIFKISSAGATAMGVESCRIINKNSTYICRYLMLM